MTADPLTPELRAKVDNAAAAVLRDINRPRRAARSRRSGAGCMGLTRQLARCLKAIAHLTHDGVSPSYEELRVFLGYGSKAQVARDVASLKARGRIASLPGRSRSLAIIGPVEQPAYDVAGLRALSAEDLDFHIALALGIRAHQKGVSDTREMMDRIGACLAGRNAA